MNSITVITDAFSRVGEAVHDAVADLTPEQLSARLDSQANTIGWLVWHLTRVQDDHVADVADHEQVWTAGGWVERFGLPFEQTATGYGHSGADVGALRISDPALLTGYYDAVSARTVDYLATLADADLDRIVDERWDPPVSLGVRLVSVVADDLQHAGQAAFIRGVLQRR